jgi:hypothetical protein
MRDYLDRADDEVLAIATIEHIDALQTIGEVVSTPGLDLAFIGPGDLATSMGHRGRAEHPEVQAAMLRIEQAIRPSPVALGGVAPTPMQANAMVARGYRALVVGFDWSLLHRDLRRTGMLELALCGVPEAQIASLSGHSIEQTRRILDTYLPRRGELALAAVERWEANEGKVLALHLLPPQRSLEEVTEQAPNGSANRTANRRATANRKSGVSA